MRAVQFDQFGGPEVLRVRDVPDPDAAPGRVVVRVRAAGINPGEIPIREGRFGGDLPSGEGSDLAGTVEAVGEGVDAVAAGDEVIGWSDERSSHAELVSVPASQVIPKPPAIPWEVAGALYVAGMAAWGSVAAVGAGDGDTVLVSAAAGGVGSIASQLAVHRGARTIGLAGEANHDWLRSRGVVPVAYGDGQLERIREAAPDGVDGLIDAFGGGYVDLALDGLGVATERVNTLIDFDAVERRGVRSQGTSATASAANLAALAALVADGAIEVPIAKAYPLDEVEQAYVDVATRHTRGKIVLVM
jgi:NADPH:quinone reductase-like Zn-dependent oxidoreductase